MAATSKILGVLGFILVVGLGTACVRRAPEPGSLRFRYWGDTEEVAILEGLIQDFEKANPGVTVRGERKSPDGSYGDLLLQEFAGHAAPDVIFLSTNNFDRLADNGRLLDLKPFLDADADLKEADFYPAVTERFSQDGKLLILPRDIAPISCIYYNKALFRAARLPYPKDDWTWEDLRRDALKLTLRREDGSVRQFGFADDWPAYDAWILAGGGRQVDDYFHPTRFAFAEGGALDGILFRYSLQRKDGVMPGSADTHALSDGTAALFLNGSLAMFHSGLWKTPGFRRITGFKWDVAPFPRKRGVQPVFFCGGSGYGINSQAADPALCWKLVKFMSGPEAQKRMAATGLAQPSLMALAKSPAFLDDLPPANKRMLLACAERALSTPAWKPWEEFMRTVWTPKMDELWVPEWKGDPAAAIRDIEKEANAKYFPQAK